MKEHKCYVIDLIISSDKNISAKVFDKLYKYTDMKIEMAENTIIVLVVEEARGIFKKFFDTGIQKITGNVSLWEMQKFLLMNIVDIHRKNLSIQYAQ